MKNKELSSLGKLVYNHSKEANMSNFTGNAEFFSYVEKIDNINAEILEKENEIDEIKTVALNSEEIEVSSSEVVTENSTIKEEKTPEDAEELSSEKVEKEAQE